MSKKDKIILTLGTVIFEGILGYLIFYSQLPIWIKFILVALAVSISIMYAEWMDYE